MWHCLSFVHFFCITLGNVWTIRRVSYPPAARRSALLRAVLMPRTHERRAAQYSRSHVHVMTDPYRMP